MDDTNSAEVEPTATASIEQQLNVLEQGLRFPEVGMAGVWRRLPLANLEVMYRDGDPFGVIWIRAAERRCTCSCHACCVPLDESCEHCEENHERT